jgi:hypothetical protein
MQINTDINILGGLPDFKLVEYYFNQRLEKSGFEEENVLYTQIKTAKSVRRFKTAIESTLLRCKNPQVRFLLDLFLEDQPDSTDSKLFLFWNSSFNNELFNYLNTQIYFPAFFSGRISIKQDEVTACLKDLAETEIELKKWSESTIKITASKYLTLIKKFNLLDGSRNKKILHPYLSDRMFVIFVYWICAIESNQNLLESDWLKYSFSDQANFLERLMQKKFFTFFQLMYTGDKLTVETILPYKNLHNAF